jgi:hypothetical protein
LALQCFWFGIYRDYFGIFFRGNAPHLTGITLAPELPLEEVFFLILLSYNALLAYQFFSKRVNK